MSKATTEHVILHWFRNDLRLHDNAALVHSCQLAKKQTNAHVIPFFAFDPSIFGATVQTAFGSVKCGPRRAHFALQAVQDLQANLKRHGGGSDLLAVVPYPQTPHDFVAQFVQKVHQKSTATPIQWTIVCQDEVLQEEVDMVNKMKAAVGSAKVECIWGSTLYELDDLPFASSAGPLDDMPNTFTPFRNKVEKACQIARPLAAPTKELAALFPSKKKNGSALATALHESLQPFLGKAPASIKDLGYTDACVKQATTVHPQASKSLRFVGGETAALARVQDYMFTKDRLRIYFDTRNGMLDADDSTKLAPWLAHGCISPRWIAHECQRYEQERGIQNKSTYWVVFELLWRDYCKFFSLKHGNRLFYPNGLLGPAKAKAQGRVVWKTNEAALAAWKEGRTGYPLVDANMRELQATGFMSNRGRQNVCSFLALDLQLDWRLGGDYFESTLLDYDVYSNWYNWCAGAGLTGGRVNRFNIVKQSKDYDQHGEYVRHWLPELQNVPTEFVHEPWKLSHFQQVEFGVQLGVDYPHRLPTAAPPLPSPAREQQGRGNRGGRSGRGGGRGGRGRGSDNEPLPKRNNNNRHQKYEMKSLKEAQIQFKKKGGGGPSVK